MISAIGGFRAAVDQEPAARFAAVAVVRDLAGVPLRDQSTDVAWQAPLGGNADTALAVAPIPSGRQVAAPALLCGSAMGPRAP